jgi:signal transduction histidine kinase
VEEMLERLKEYTFIMSQAKNIQLKWIVNEEQIKNIILPMDHRRNIYLICKEAINNAVKYSACRQIVISGMHEKGAISFRIRDDGKGFDIGDFSRGNGLRNMKERAKECSLDLEIESAEGHGTEISIHYSITQ